MRTYSLIILSATLLFVFGSVLFPTVSSAALNAGVVNGVWFSTATPEEGEKVRIFTAIQNQSNETIQGNVAFLVNTEIVGTTSFTVQSNDIIPVSIQYIFPGGDYDVSAYITSVKDQNVAYTIVSETSVSVSRRDSEEKVSNTIEESSAASSTLSETKEVFIESGKDILDKIEPIAESTAVRIEEFRDSILATTTSEISQTDTITSPPTQKESVSKGSTATSKFLSESKDIVTTKGLSVWKKTVGISLSFAALLVRFWFIPLVLFIGIVFWLLVRGRRIR